jgi:hypothetical protein
MERVWLSSAITDQNRVTAGIGGGCGALAQGLQQRGDFELNQGARLGPAD